MSRDTCQALKEYCINKLENTDLLRFITLHYVLPVQERAKEKGLEIPNKTRIRNVVNKRYFDKDVVDILEELAQERKERLGIS